MAAALGPRWLARSAGFRAAMAPVEAALLEEVDRRRRAGENGPRDIVSILIEARYEDGSRLSDEEMRDELMTLLTDGPTSSSLAWVFERLLRHPEKLARLQAEVDRRRGGRSTWTRWCRRRCGSARRCRSSSAACWSRWSWAATTLPAGAVVAPCVYLIHRNEEIYPNPRHFLPERFLERPPGTYTWIPFGGGTRRCLAASYAELEMKRVLRTVLSEVELRPADSDSERAPEERDLLQPRQARPRRRRAAHARPRPATGRAMAAESDLLVVGAGAKAAGIAAKVHAFNSLGLGPVSLKIVEGTEVAASWKGRNGMTSGEEPLAVTPIKDVGFPYQSFREFGEAGEAIDEQAMGFSWQRYMVARRRYARWIDAGSPQVRHRDYGEYLTWVLSRATEGVGHVEGRVTRVSLAEGERWAVEVEEAGGSSRHTRGGAGPDRPRRPPRLPARAGHRLAGLPLRQQARGVRAAAGGERLRRRDRRRRRERAELHDVPARLPPPLPLHDLHADAADEPRRELPREPRLLQPRRGRLERRSTRRRGATSSSTPTAASSTRRAWRRSPTTTAAASSPAASPTSPWRAAARESGSATSRTKASPGPSTTTS